MRKVLRSHVETQSDFESEMEKRQYLEAEHYRDKKIKNEVRKMLLSGYLYFL